MSADIAENNKQEAMPILPKKRIAMAVFVIACAVVLMLGAVAGSAWGYVKVYDNKIYPGIYLGTYHLGGLTQTEVKKFIDNLNSRLDEEGINYIFLKDGVEQKIKIDTVMLESESAIELISFDADKFVGDVMKIGRSSNWLLRHTLPWRYRWFPERVVLPVKIDTKNFSDILKQTLSSFEIQPKNAAVEIVSLAPVAYKTIDEATGDVFNIELILNDTVRKLKQLNFELIAIEMRTAPPSVSVKDLDNFEEKIKSVINRGEVVFSYPDAPANMRKEWRIKPSQFYQWIEPKRIGGNIYALLNFEKTNKYFENIAAEIDQPAEESKFLMADGKVTEFKSGRTGRILNREKTFSELEVIFTARQDGNNDATSTCLLTVDTVEPAIKLADINNFGITGIIGVGESTFRDSHTNRIKNIAHAVERLNGTIISPGEEFSTVKYAGPFTLENGYLPEEVIKGTLIKKEVGGGMCQIGTTLFRMAMNSGMPITERTNHSLVVGYYADPVNGNPGTDATVYEPILDFKFLNDTGSYLLLQTEIDFKKQKLTFTLWGKPDGRSGFYTHPIVSKWIPAGEPQERIVDTLAPGETKCQNAFRGAVASFTYTRFTSTSERIDRVFESYYRPLPKICMVGAGSASSTPDGGSISSSTPPVFVTTTQ